MLKGSFWHVAKPASDETDVGWRNLKGMVEKQRPKIKRERCAKPNEDGTNEGESQSIHASPVY